MDEGILLQIEEHLSTSIVQAAHLLETKPAEAHPGKDCRYCPVRARCDLGWAAHQAAIGRPSGGTTDVEVVLTSKPSPTGFIGQAFGYQVNVVYEASIGKSLPNLDVAYRSRLLDAVVCDSGETFEVRPWTEVYALRCVSS